MKKLKKHLLSFLAGTVNALFGAGGGIIAVNLFKSMGLTQKTAQASALYLILPISVLSTVMYYRSGYLDIGQAVKYIPFGLLGALTGTKLLSKLPDKVLKNIFSAFMIYSGIRLILR